MGRISTCPLTIHAIIHLISSTRHAGPLSRIWEFVTERYMGKIARSVTSRQYPFSQLAETIKKQEQIKTVAIKLGLEEELFLTNNRRDWSVLGSQESMILEISKYGLSSPSQYTHLASQMTRQFSRLPTRSNMPGQTKSADLWPSTSSRLMVSMTHHQRRLKSSYLRWLNVGENFG